MTPSPTRRRACVLSREDRKGRPEAGRVPLPVFILTVLATVVSASGPACSPRGGRASVACMHCGSMLSPHARACPRCGEPTAAADIVVNSIGMQLLPIAAGRFTMGASAGDAAAGEDERPEHAVDISEPFLIGVTEVTQEQFRSVMGFNPSAFAATGARLNEVTGLDTDRFPVESVTWREAMDFCERLSQMPGEREQGRRYRLPTEAEWEYAAKTTGAVGSRSPRPPARDSANRMRPCDVGDAAGQDGGLVGMTGNVSEWTDDWFSSDAYVTATGRNPKSVEDGVVKSFRGAAWNSLPTSLRVTARDADLPEARRDDLGFRIVCVRPAPGADGLKVSAGDPEDVVLRPSAVPASRMPAAADLSGSLPAWKRAVVRLNVRTDSGQGQGSGFVIDNHGTVVTNFHVIAGASDVTAFFSDGFQERIGGTLGVMPDKDLAFLKLASGESRCQPLTLSESLPREGRVVYALGCPLGLGFTLTQGIVSGIRSAAELREAFRSEGIRGPGLSVQWVQTTAAINWGNSGGPLIDDSGQVVGVNTLVLGRKREEGVAEGLNFAVSSQDVLRAYRAIGDRAKPSSQRE